VQADFSGSKDRNRPLSAFMDRVVARFGPDSLLMPVLVESHVPERASLYLSLQDADRRKPPKLQPEAYVRSARPLRLFSHPELVEAVVAGIPDGAPAGFRWRRIAYRIARSEGPERLEAEWWVDGETAPARDYFRVEDDTGRRFWLFRRGLYGQQAVMPQWFLHGIFA
jgi:protein ImuB